MEVDNECSTFEREFLDELNKKMFPSSFEQVRRENYEECQTILRQTQIYSSSSIMNSQSISDDNNNNNIEVSPRKLIIYEHVYLLPEEV